MSTPFDPAPTPPPAGYPPYAGYGYPAPPRNGFGTTALVLGIVGVVFAIIPITFWLGAILGVLAIVFGLLGRRRVRRAEATNGRQSVVGAWLGVAALVIAALWVALFVRVIHDAGPGLDRFGRSLQAYQRCLQRAQTTAERQACQQELRR